MQAILSTSFCHAQDHNTDSLTNIYLNAESDSIRYKAAINLSNFYIDRDAQKVLLLTDTLIKETELKTYPELYVGIISSKLLALNRLSEYQDAIATSELLEKEAAKFGLLRYQAIALNSRGNTHYILGAFEKSADLFYEVFSLGQDLEDFSLQVIALNNMANAYMSTNDFEKVRSIYLQGLDIAKENQMRLDEASILTGLGNMENKRQNLNSARDYFKEAYEIFNELSHEYGKGLALANLGHVEFQVRNYQLAIDYNKRSQEVREKINDKLGLLRLHINNSDIYKEQLNWPLALKESKSAMELLGEVKRPSDMESVLKTLVEIYERTEVYDSALYLFKQLTQLQDSLRNADLNNSLQERKTALDTTFYKHQIRELKGRESSLKRRNQWTLMVAFLLFASILFFWIRDKRKVQELKNASKNIADDVKQTTENSKLKELKEKLKQGGLDGAFWIQFGLIFDEIHPGFSQKLTSEYASLTNNEVRICCLIRLGLNTYDLAECLTITTSSVRKARYRIYKKMELSSDKELVKRLYSL